MKAFILSLIFADAQYLTNKFHAEVHHHFVYLDCYDDVFSADALSSRKG
jgi:hypothetical protein